MSNYRHSLPSDPFRVEDSWDCKKKKEKKKKSLDLYGKLKSLGNLSLLVNEESHLLLCYIKDKNFIPYITAPI